jgi:hypothetical protein
MAAAVFIACSAPPGYVTLNSLKDSQHFWDGSSCYINSCNKIMLCLHWSLAHQPSACTPRERNPMESTQGIERARSLSLHSHRGGRGSNPSLVMWDFVKDKIGAGAGFLRELRFPLPIYIPFTSPQSSSLSPEAGTIGQEWPQCQ